MKVKFWGEILKIFKEAPESFQKLIGCIQACYRVTFEGKTEENRG